MLYKALTGKLTIAAFVIAVCWAIIKFGVKEYGRSQAERKKMEEQIAPIISRMNDQAFQDTKWKYSGPVGKLELAFKSDGKFTYDSDGSSKSGAWKIMGPTVSLVFLDSDLEHIGLFRDSPDILVGGIQGHTGSKKWTAKRISHQSVSP